MSLAADFDSITLAFSLNLYVKIGETTKHVSDQLLALLCFFLAKLFLFVRFIVFPDFKFVIILTGYLQALA
jgi:hypothetical protein